VKKLFLPVLLTILIPFLTRAQGWTLQSCVDSALKYNLSVLQSKEQLSLSELTLLQSRWNPFPTLNASLSQIFSFGRGLDQSTYQYNNKKAALNNFSLNSGVVLFNGGLLNNTIKQNQVRVEVARLDLDQIKDDISLGVINAFVNILYAEESVKNARMQIESTRQLMDRLSVMVQAGKKAESDLAQLRAQLANDEYNLVVAEGQMRNQKLALQQLMDRPYSEGFEIIAPPLPDDAIVYIPDAGDVYASALNTQSGVKSSEMKIEVEKLGMRLVEAGLLPRLSFNAGLSSSYSSIRRLTEMKTESSLETIGFLKDNMSQEVVSYVPHNTYQVESYHFFRQVKDNFNQAISLNLSVPIFNGRQVRNNMRRQEIAIRQAELDDKLVKNNLRKNIEQATVDAGSAQKKYMAAKEALKTEKLSYDNVQLLFEVSKSTAIDLLVEKNKLAVTESQLLQARYDWILKLKVLEYYQGGSLYSK
jgi:outer membrane protein